MVGSSMNCAAPMTILNVIVGRQLIRFKGEVDKLIKKGIEQDTALLTIIKQYINESKPIIFEGDGYSEEWKKEAKKRGLSNTPNTPEALKVYKTKKVRDLFTTTGLFSEAEMDAHYEVMFETYSLKMDIEARTLVDLSRNMVLPAALAYQTKVAKNIAQLKNAGMSEDTHTGQTKLLKNLSKLIERLIEVTDKLDHSINKTHKSDFEDTAHAFCYKVKPLMMDLRTVSDELELIIEDSMWPLAKYREMMFIR